MPSLPSRLRWLLVAQDEWGLGHVARHIGLARAIRRARVDDDILVMTYSEASHLFWREGFATFKLPGPRRLNPNTRGHLSRDSQTWVTRSAVNAAVDGYRPHIVVTDSYPAGLESEFAGLLDAPALRCFIAQESRFLSARGTQMAIARYHLVLALHRPHDVELPLPSGPQVEWVGHILVRNRDEALPRDTARRLLGLGEAGRAGLVTLGGGGSGDYGKLVDWIADAAKDIPGWTFAFAEPPLLASPVMLPAAANLRVVRHFPLVETMAAFDLAVAISGSSIYELADFGVPSIIVPSTQRVSPEEHPEKSARVAAQTGGTVVPAFDVPGLRAALAEMTSEARLTAARAKLADWRAGITGGDGDGSGADRAVAVMLDALAKRTGRRQG